MRAGKHFQGIVAAALFTLSTGFAGEALALCKECGTVVDMKTIKSSTTTYQVVVKMEEGKTRTFTYANPTSYAVGDKVKMLDKKLVRQ